MSKFSSVENPIKEQGWKGISITINAGLGASGNAGSVGQQVSTTYLLNTVKPTSQRSITDKISNAISPIMSTILKRATGN